MTKAECNKLVGMLFAAWPREREGARETRDVYLAGLVDLPLPLALKAVEFAIKHDKWLPSVAELRERCDALRPPQRFLPEPSPDSTYEERAAWAREMVAKLERGMRP